MHIGGLNSFYLSQMYKAPVLWSIRLGYPIRTSCQGIERAMGSNWPNGQVTTTFIDSVFVSKVPKITGADRTFHSNSTFVSHYTVQGYFI